MFLNLKAHVGKDAFSPKRFPHLYNTYNWHTFFTWIKFMSCISSFCLLDQGIISMLPVQDAYGGHPLLHFIVILSASKDLARHTPPSASPARSKRMTSPISKILTKQIALPTQLNWRYRKSYLLKILAWLRGLALYPTIPSPP